MDIAPEEKQNNQTQEKQPQQGPISRSINSFNSLRGANKLFSNPLGKIGSRVIAQAALRGFAAFLAGPGFPIAVALGLVLLFTVIIVMGFGGVPGDLSPQIPTPTPVP